MDNWDRLY